MENYPTNKAITKGEIADYWFEDGILVSMSKSIKRTVPLIAANVDLVKQLTNNTPVPLLTYLKSSPVPDAETRRFSAAKLPEIYSAMAMVAQPGLSKFIMNILFSLQKPPIPMKSFTNAQQAKAWLKKISQ